MRFFLLKPYDFGASGKNIKTGGEIPSDFPFKTEQVSFVRSYSSVSEVRNKTDFFLQNFRVRL